MPHILGIAELKDCEMPLKLGVISLDAKNEECRLILFNPFGSPKSQLLKGIPEPAV